MRHGALSPMLICVFITFMKGEDNMVDLSNVIMEDGMTAKQRNALKTNKFALVYKDDNKKTVRKYPVHDERHVKAASKLFPRGVPEEYQGQVARRILKEAKKYNLDTSGWTTVNEAAEKDAKKVINEFDNPIDAVKYHIDGSMDFKKSIVKVDMFTSGSLRESIKQLERPNLKPTMFIGFMDPEDVNRCEFKDLEKHVVYATDTGMLYSSFFNSFARRNEVSNIASSVDTLLNDLQNKKVTELHIPAHMKDCMILLESNERTIHSKGNVPMKLVCENGCYMNTYYSYFAIYEAFEFKKNMLFRNISEILLETFDGDETHFDFESIEVVQETFGSANINIRFRYDNEPFIVVVPTSSMKTSPGKIFHEGSRNEESEMNTDEETTPSSSEETTVEDNTPNENEEVKVEHCAGANGFGICYQEMDDSGLIKVNDVPHSKMYFGSCKDFGNNMLKLKNPRLFVTPFKGIASIFTTDRRRYNIPPGKSVNLAYDEWHASDLEEPFEDIHVIVEGMPEYEDRTFESTGWIYGIDVDKLRDHIYQEPWMDSKKEFLIIDVPEIPIAEKLRVEPLIHVRGGEERKAPQGFNEYSLYHNHSVPLTEKNVRKYMKNGTAEMTMPLQHLKLNDNVNGYIWDNRRGDITAYVAVEAKDDDKWIRAINTTRAYQEAGLYDYLLKFAEKELGADHIVVNESDYSLLSTCLEHDWIKYEESDGNIYLTKDNIYVEHTDPEDYEDIHDHMDDEDDIFNESATDNNFEINLDEWAPGNPLWITGSSGDGKSTFAIKKAKENNAFLVPLDLFLVRIAKPKEKYEKFLNDKSGTVVSNGSEMIKEYIDAHPELPWANPSTKGNWDPQSKSPKLWNDLFDYLIKNAKDNSKYKNKLIIFEGCNICLMPVEKAKKLPIIIMGTSKLTASKRRIDRDKKEHSDYSMLKILFRELKRANGESLKALNKAKDDFKKDLKKSIKKDEKEAKKAEHIQEAAYTNGGINKANVRPVMIVYKRFSTKNKEQLGPIAKMWEIANKYFPEPKMLSGFGWDWTGWETDFAYGIIINDRKIPEGFMEELRKEFPDITLDENFLIPKKYEEVYSCSESKMNEVYDKIWDKGFLECELEDYPSAGKMKISVIYKKDKAELDEEVAKHIKDVKKDEPIQEAFFGIGFGNLRKTIADRLGKYCTVTNVQNPTGKEEKFVIKLNEDPEDFVNVVSTGTGVKAYGYKHGERFSIFNNATLSAAAQRLIDAICDEFNIKLSLQEAFSMFINEDDEVSPRQ